MNILYKYCDHLGGIKILSSLELKLPYISDVNDPYDGRPIYCCGDDYDKMKKKIEDILNRRGNPPPINLENTVENFFKSPTAKKNLIDNARGVHEGWNKENCILCLSKTAKSPPMWAHYAGIHQGIVIGIDCDTVFSTKRRSEAIDVYDVVYPEERQKIDILDVDAVTHLKSLTTKASYWTYEVEKRCIFAAKSIDNPGADLETLQQEGLALLKRFRGKRTWFLRLNPLSIREVIFGLRAEKRLKLAIRRLLKHLPNAKLFQAEESETYDFDLIELKT